MTSPLPPIRRAALAALALLACNQGPAPPPAKLLVVASFYPLYEFARQVAGPFARVVSLVPPGVEPHDWEPSPQDLTRIRDARVFIYNGAGLEPWVAKLVMRLGGEARVLEPPELVELVRETARETLARYDAEQARTIG